MTKKEFIDKFAEKADIYKKDAARIVDAFTDTVSDVLVSGDKVQFIGFGTFEVVNREARVARNPKTGEPVEVPACKVPKFKPTQTLKDKMNN